MTLARRVVPGDAYMIQRRVLRRAFRLSPSCPAVQEVFLYCLAYAAMKYQMEVFAFVLMSTHWLCAALHNQCYVEFGVMRSCFVRPALGAGILASDSA